MFSIEELAGKAFTVLISIRLCGISGSCESEGKLKKEFFVNFGFINQCDNNFNTHSWSSKSLLCNASAKQAKPAAA